MSGRKPADSHAHASTGDSQIASLVDSLSNLGIGSTNSFDIDNLPDTFFNLAIGQESSNVYNVLEHVTPTSLVSVDSAIEIYAFMIGYYEDQLDLDKEDPQLDVVRDLMAARKCWVILHEQRRALVIGEGKIDEIWAELRRFWSQ